MPRIDKRNPDQDLAVLSIEEEDSETLYVLRNLSLMKQIEISLKTFRERKGYWPTLDELEALVSEGDTEGADGLEV